MRIKASYFSRAYIVRVREDRRSGADMRVFDKTKDMDSELLLVAARGINYNLCQVHP